jgi:hypothetical protein
MATDEEIAAQRHVEKWAKDKPHFHKVPGLRERMAHIIHSDLQLLNQRQPGLGTVREGKIDFDHAYKLAKLTHPETLDEIRKAERRERDYKPPQQKRDPGETPRATILRSMRELEEHG